LRDWPDWARVRIRWIGKLPLNSIDCWVEITEVLRTVFLGNALGDKKSGVLGG
jgi:hypothetical protein